MLELRTIKDNGNTFIGVKLGLPRQPIYIIYTTQCIVVGVLYDIHNFNHNIAVVQVNENKSFNDLLNSRCIDMNDKAKCLGYELDMKGIEVLSHSLSKENKEKI